MFQIYVHPELDKPSRKSIFRGASKVYRTYIKSSYEEFETFKIDPETIVNRPTLSSFIVDKRFNRHISIKALKKWSY